MDITFAWWEFRHRIGWCLKPICPMCTAEAALDSGDPCGAMADVIAELADKYKDDVGLHYNLHCVANDLRGPITKRPTDKDEPPC